MNYSKFYTESNRILVNSLLSLWVPGLKEEQEYLRNLLEQREPLISEPVFQSIFPWESSKETFENHATKLGIFDKAFVKALDSIDNPDFRFPLDRHPYKHQTKSWEELLVHKKTIVVTSGTGSGKTECFMMPVLQDILRSNVRGRATGVRAIFLYPLNALTKNQQQRIDAWCRALSPQITYAIYNGDTAEDLKKVERNKKEKVFPQLISRKDIRENPPQILFTNPTMLNYMLVRPEDQPILQQSQGKLNWILLDEAHTYSGSSAAELALQIRRVIDAFGVKIEDVNFALTSATIGDPNDPSTKVKLRRFVAQITGKDIKDIEVIDGKRVVPELARDKANALLNDIDAKYDAHVSLDELVKLRNKLNISPYLALEEIARPFNKKLSREAMLELVDELGEKIAHLNVDDSDGALLPSRIHLFVRNIKGVYACTNPECPSRKKYRPLNIGSLTTYQNTTCPDCHKPLLEVATCPSCGKPVLIGEQSNDVKKSFRLRVNTYTLERGIFDYVSDDVAGEIADDNSSVLQNTYYDPFIIAKNDKPCPRNSILQTNYVIDHTKDRIKIAEESAHQINDDVYTECLDNSNRPICPHCGESLQLDKLNYMRSSSTIMGRFLAPLLLDNTAATADPNDVDVIYEGRKYITFTDSRQNTARSAMGLNMDVERSWIRSSIFNKLSEMRLQNFVPGGGLTDEEEQTYNYLKGNVATLPPFLKKQLHDLENKKSGSASPEAKPIPWRDIEQSLENDAELKKLYRHLGEARGSSFKGEDATPLNYLRALYIDQFGWIPKRANSLETMGIISLVYPTLKLAHVPLALANRGFTNDDWQNFMKICLDYFVRANRHYFISESYSQYLTQANYCTNVYPPGSEAHIGNKPVSRWPVLQVTGKGKVEERQSRIVLLLCAALGLDNAAAFKQEDIDLVNGSLKEAWNFISQNILTQEDAEHNGFMLDLIDPSKVCLKIIDKAWLCPVDNVPVATIFKGYSPRISGYISAGNFERFKIDINDTLVYPYFPYPYRLRRTQTGKEPVSDQEIDQWIRDNLKKQIEKGLFSSLHERIYQKRPIFIAGEHSGQQQREVLDKYEKDFNDGRLNILSCSTTMEMGVDLKGISEVVMNDVPPKPANYLQRAGRAGRRQETKALALTFCAPNPIGMYAWNTPGWAMAHVTAMSEVRLESAQIIQRNVNSFLFGSYVVDHGGIKVKSSIEDFFGGEISTCDHFCDYLDKLCNMQGDYQKIAPHFSRLVSRTSYQAMSLEDAAYRTKKQIQFIKKAYQDRVSALDKAIEDAEESSFRQLRAVENRKKIYLNEALMSYLAENNFLPSAGIPTGLVEFIPRLDRISNDTKFPTMHISQAISKYAPGKNVVINEWCYKPSGIEMKSRFDATKKNVIQYCDNCNYTTIVYGQPLEECPCCHKHGTMHGLKGMAIGDQRFTEIVEPSGFTVDWSSKPVRVLNDRSGFGITEPVLLEMDPWNKNANGAKFMIRKSTKNAEILFFNKGKGYGYALCPYCGRMQEEIGFAGATNDKHPLVPHKHLVAGKECQGNDNGGANIRRNVLLVGRYQTDLVEMKFYDKDNNEITDVSTLYSLGTILSRKLVEVLGINEGEVDFGYNPSYNSIFIYDTALGGAGYSTLMFDYKEQVFDAAYKALSECTCEQACTHCLIDRQTQWFINYLDRHKAIEWLEMERDSKQIPEDVKKLYPEAKKVTADIQTELYHLMRSSEVNTVDVFVSANIAQWEPDMFPFARNLDEMMLNSVKVNFILEKAVDVQRLSASEINSYISTISKFRNQTFYRTSDFQVLHPMLRAKYNDGRTIEYFTQNSCIDYNEDWGKEGDIYVTETHKELEIQNVSFTQILDALSSNKQCVFEFSMKKDSSTNELLSTMMSYENQAWSSIIAKVKGTTHVQVHYTDRYLKTPLGCFMLAHLIAQIKKTFGIQLESLEFLTTTNSNEFNRNQYAVDEDVTEDFGTYQHRDEFLKQVTSEICGLSCKISHSYVPHQRCLSLVSDNWELSIRPDGGIAYGWTLNNRVNPELGQDDIINDLDMDVSLYNREKTASGILYTVAFRMKD